MYQYPRFTFKSRYTDKKVTKTIRNSLKKPVFEKRNTYLLCELQFVTKKNNTTIQHSAEMTHIQASKKSNNKTVHSNLQDKRKKREPKYKLGISVRTADIKKTFPEKDIQVFHIYFIR